MRNWVQIIPPDPLLSTVKIMTYNILAQRFVRPNWYQHCRPEILDPVYRFNNILNEINQCNPDILTLQEVEYKTFLSLKTNLVDYECVFANHMPDNQIKAGPLHQIGLAILFKPAKFENLTHVNVTAVEDVQKIIKKNKLKNEPLFQKILDPYRHEGSQILALYDKTTRTRFIIANTHLFWNPNHSEIKFLHLARFFQELNRVKKVIGGEPYIILPGDYNTMSDSPILKIWLI